MSRYFCVALLMVISTVIAEAQQLDQIGKKGGLKTSGGISVNQVYKDQVTAGDLPYSLVMAGNLSASSYGFAIPVSFTRSNYH